ncbi:type IV secretion protein Rhs, partial [Pseudomonas sp. SH10-3B]|uniref:RHS repeat-associated core domain-containing protein n=1 Tax=Pseudomonas sp. SH10-3B TaxID=2816049 RepID=UPI00243422C6
SGLHYNRHRYYNPDIGRYLTPDPVKLAGGINAYQYVPNPARWVDPLGLSACPGEDRCNSPSEIEKPTEQIEVDERSPSVPTPDKKRAYLYRGDLREPDEIFEKGFESRGSSTDLFLHALNNASPPSNFVPTSTSRKQALVFASGFGFEEGFLYTLKRIPGRDVNKELGVRSKHKNELEIAIPERIDTKHILGASPVNEDGTFKGYTILNPNREYP